MLLASLLTIAAIAADQFVAPILYSSSPLWTTAIFLILVWRRGYAAGWSEAESEPLVLPYFRLIMFGAAHFALLVAAMRLTHRLSPLAGSVSSAGWLLAGLKLLPVAPALILAPVKWWRTIARTYRAECVAAVLVLFTFFPGRIFDALWPWYGQLLGRFCFFLARMFVPSLTYAASLTPTLQGPDLDVTILPACSGLSGIELFDYLAALIAILDWNRLRKGYTALAYFGGILTMLVGNALRITTLVVLGNRGFVDFVARFHISAGSLFFSAIFLVYLSATYRHLLSPPERSRSAF